MISTNSITELALGEVVKIAIRKVDNGILLRIILMNLAKLKENMKTNTIYEHIGLVCVKSR